MADNAPSSNENQDKLEQKAWILKTIGFFAKKKRINLIRLNIIRKQLAELKESEVLTLAEINACNQRMKGEILNNLELLRGDLNIPESDDDKGF